MSACGYLQTFQRVSRSARFDPDTGHSKTDVYFSPDFVRFTPDTGHKWVAVFLSANDPKQTLLSSRPTSKLKLIDLVDSLVERRSS
jgi:hypothetical protein